MPTRRCLCMRPRSLTGSLRMKVSSMCSQQITISNPIPLVPRLRNKVHPPPVLLDCCHQHSLRHHAPNPPLCTTLPLGVLLQRSRPSQLMLYLRGAAPTPRTPLQNADRSPLTGRIFLSSPTARRK